MIAPLVKLERVEDRRLTLAPELEVPDRSGFAMRVIVTGCLICVATGGWFGSIAFWTWLVLR